MLFAVQQSSVGFMWIAIEATTIPSAVLIPLHLSKASVEASWKSSSQLRGHRAGFCRTFSPT